MEIVWFIAIWFLLAFIAGIALGVNKNKAAAQTTQRVTSEYRVNELFVSSENRSFVGINFDGHKIVLGSGNYEGAYDFAQISSVEVIENGVTVTQTNRGSQLLGAAVGGLAFGG